MRSASGASSPPRPALCSAGAASPARPAPAGGRRAPGSGRGGARPPEEATGGRGRATTGPAEVGSDAALLQASQAPHTTGEPGWRWRQPPAASAPVWLEKPQRKAALAILRGVGWLGSSRLPRLVRLARPTPDQQRPGTQGLPAPPPAAVGVTVGAHVVLIQCVRGAQAVGRLSGGQPHHLLLWDALGLDRSWDTAPSAPKSARGMQTP